MALISLRNVVPVAVICLSSSVALAEDPPAADAAAKPADSAAAAPASAPAAEKKEDAAADPKTRPSPNTVFLELGGAGFIYSLNYERRLLNDDLGVRAGFGFFTAGASASAGGSSASSSYTFMSIPVTASYLGIRSGKHGLELGGGAALRYETAGGSSSAGGNTASGEASAFDAYGVVMVGYRLHPVGRTGFNFRIGAMALAGKRLNYLGTNVADFGVLPFGYMSFGASF